MSFESIVDWINDSIGDKIIPIVEKYWWVVLLIPLYFLLKSLKIL